MKREDEDKIKEYWKKKRIYEKLKKRKGKKFYFLDGPPYATGYIHMGTAWNKILKDAHIRFWRMKGFDVWDQPGYDTHGLPIENKVEKELGIKSKSDIEEIGIERFILACRDFATRFIGIMNKQFADLGVWMDWENPYLTLENSYIEGAWATFKIAFDKGLLYRGVYPVHVCGHCQTAVAYNEIEYSKVSDPSIYVKFKVHGKKDEYIVIWTTTPWTLPSNTGVMAKPDADYAKARVGESILILAKDLLEEIMKKIGTEDYDILEIFKGKRLEGLKYEHPFKEEFKFQKNLLNAHRIVLSDQYVTLDTGTGLVHTAPGHGQEDFKVGKENGLPVLSPVNMNGTYDESCGEFSGVFVKHADRQIIKNLEEKGLLLHEERINHDYPQCWRCNSPLLIISVPQWFFKVTDIRDQLIRENEKVNWYPSWAKQRFRNWLESLSDWPISRQRYWGIPLPIWTCTKCDEVKVIGSAEEFGKDTKDLHRPYIDKIKLKCKCGSQMERIKDVLDVWFDSGLAAWASLGYPKNKELFEKLWKCDLQIEGPDQIRGWWNSELITGVITFNETPFTNILFHGFVLDFHGIKMSKSKGNIVDPEEVTKKYGTDVLRFYLLSSPPWEDFYFKWIDVESVARSFTVIENTFNFVKTYASEDGSEKEMLPEDKWIVSRMNSVIGSFDENMKTYNIHKAVNELHNFIIDDFSRWYIKIIRDRVWPSYSGKDKKGAIYALRNVSRKLLIMLAPICPFLVEKINLEIFEEESIHLLSIPEIAEENMHIQILMEIVKEIVEACNSIRKENDIKLKWPIKSI
ncbi:MAG: isoleucine--tRNA ligase, partial [Candidatus Aenigmarchaeota archaeon]|nr:isoleucine--tRNA ligase [Candidatus Aenigmarchaeota archaeon]MDI6722375.1 isoleucine--tRNA ligase [Candidatus Aenigmarchaeota archaeon]